MWATVIWPKRPTKLLMVAASQQSMKAILFQTLLQTLLQHTVL